MAENKIVEEKSTQEIEQAIIADQNAVPYVPLSKLPSLGTVVPLNLAGETMQAQFSFSESHNDIDAYLVEKLKYSSKFSLSQALSAEQVDAVAFAINQIENGKGFILADMAGIGKGRVNASVLRYAQLNGYLPIFITEKSNLFSAIYRDILDIGGMTEGGKFPATTKEGGKPLIINGFKSGGYEKTYDEKGKRIRIPKPSPNSITDRDGKEIIIPPTQEKIQQIISGKKLPKEFDYVFLTYSQLSGKGAKPKLDYLKRIIDSYEGKVVICLDECHNASGITSSTGECVRELIQLVQGVLFSSATFSKRPDNMYVYALKTDVMTSPLGYDDLISVIKEGGERLIENLASNLVACNQMLRRERSYDNCNVEYNYMDESDKIELYKKYDSALQLYKNLQQFFVSDRFAKARRNVIERIAKKNKINLCEEVKPKKKAEQDEWNERNAGKYYISMFTAGDMKRNQFQFIETLLFALKAEFVVEQVLGNKKKNILGQITYDGWENTRVSDKEKFKSSRKPVIAVRNTLEGVYYSLGLEVDSEIDKADFSMYVYALALDAMSGVLGFREIKKDGSKGKEIKEEFEIADADFEDNGKEFRENLKKIEGIDLNIPLSPIDYIIDAIEQTPRPSWDEYGDGKYFKVGEVTGRKFSLKKQKNGKYKLLLNPKEKNKSNVFKKFNSGFYDVLLINESGSTGEDAHSSENFKDQRPRVMIIHQVELDVNTEVQKRGRINRTGMVNYPTYIYAISRIPSEIRRLLMLVRKLRSLDANTTGNQKQSAKLSTIRDGNGQEIQDIINKYGDECLEEFLSVPSFSQKYQKYMPSEDAKYASSFDEFVVQSFIRNLELAFCEEQEVFFNTINSLYIQKREELGDNFDLETTLSDLKAVIKTRLVRSKGQNTNPFDSSVYEEDDYVLAEDKPYSKEKVEDLVEKTANGKDPEEVYQKFIEDYVSTFKKHLKEIVDEIPLPDTKGIKDKERLKELQQEYDDLVKETIEKETEQHEQVLNIIDGKRVYTKSNIDAYETPSNYSSSKSYYYELKSYLYEKETNSEGTWYKIDEGWVKKEDITKEESILKPNTPVLIPAVIEECYEKDNDGNPIVPKIYNNARFIGVRLLNTAKQKYSPMNIELIFCQLSGKPKLTFKPTLKGREVLNWIMVRSVTIEDKRKIEINNWEIDPNRREYIRLFTGNILAGYQVAKETIARNENYSPIVKFLKFTTADGSAIRVGIKLTSRLFVPLNPDNATVDYPLNSKELVKDLEQVNYTRATNALENFRFYKNRDNIEIIIFGGTARDKKDGSPTRKRKYFNKCFADSNFRNLVNSEGLRNYEDDYYAYKPFDSSKNTYIKAYKIYVDYSTDKEKLQKIFNYIYAETPFVIGISYVEGDEAIKRTEEEVRELVQDVQDEQDQPEGEFKYDTMKPYQYLKDKLNNFSKFAKFENDVVYLKRRANIREAISYDLIPLDNTLADMVSDTFELIYNDSEKLKLKQTIENLVKDKKPSYEIGKLVQNALKGKIISVKSVFGTDDTQYIGDVFEKFVRGEIDLPKPVESKKEKQKREPRPISLENAEEFLIHLNFKIKNK